MNTEQNNIGEDKYYEAEGAAAAAQAENEYNEALEIAADQYCQSLPESVWMSPSVSDIAKAFIAGLKFKHNSTPSAK